MDYPTLARTGYNVDEQKIFNNYLSDGQSFINIESHSEAKITSIYSKRKRLAAQHQNSFGRCRASTSDILVDTHLRSH
eukprot:scaffold196003_cov18-Prasinocladus_malaysianus.AAC.1